MGDPKGFMKHGRQTPDIEDPVSRIGHFEEHYRKLSDESVQVQAARCMDCGVPFCMSGCPLGNLIPEWNDLVYRGQWREALQALHATNNFPEFTGRICPAPCEHSCVLAINEPAVAIKLMEQAIIDKGFAEGWIKPEPPATRSGKRVAIIGSGPAGLACAQQLNRAGHLVTVYERADRPGGLLTYGVPDYKLRWGVIERRLQQLEAEGIEFRCSINVGVDLPWSELHDDYDAVVLAIGSEAPRDVKIEGRELAGIHFAMEFLPQANRIANELDDPEALHPEQLRIDPEGKRVLVIGGGDTASDCIGNCIRLGAENVINLDYHEEKGFERPPGNPWPQWANIKYVSSSHEEMLHFGGDQIFQYNTQRFLGSDGRVEGLELVKVDWSQGRPPKPVPGSEQTIEADLVLLAVGYAGAIRDGLVEQLGCELDERNRLATDERTRMTSVEGVFAAGDCRRGASLIVWAIAEGREVARCVDEYLTRQPSLLPEVRIEAFAF